MNSICVCVYQYIFMYTLTQIHTYIHNTGSSEFHIKAAFLHLDAAAHQNKTCKINKQIRPYANEAAALTFIPDCV